MVGRDGRLSAPPEGQGRPVSARPALGLAAGLDAGTARVSGSKRAFWPKAVRDLPDANRTAIFGRHPDGSRASQLQRGWFQREYERCADPDTGYLYFTEQYGSVEPPAGDPVPFVLWKSQREALHVIRRSDVTLVLKARRLGLSWLALHYAVWLAVFAPRGEGARIVIICKNERDAKKLLARCRRIIERLPGWVKPTLAGDNVTTLSIADTGAEIMSLAATEDAVRQETLSLLIWDEAAFTRHKKAPAIWKAAYPAIEGGGQAIIISTGNGRSGDGAWFAESFVSAHLGVTGFAGVFLDRFARPGRDAAWFEMEKKRIGEQAANTEYPLTIDDALSGSGDPQVYPLDGILSAERLGRLLDDHHRDVILDEGVNVGGDWGDFQTFAVYETPLPGGGGWVVDELVLMRTETTAASHAILRNEPAGLACGIRSTRFDASPAGSNRTFQTVLDEYHGDQPEAYPRTHHKVPFGVYKQGGGDKRGIDTSAYIERLLWQTIEVDDAVSELRETNAPLAADFALGSAGYLAVSPRCRVLLHQLRELRRDPETGKIIKGDLDPKDSLKGDHGPDALIALFSARAREARASLELTAPGGPGL